MLPKNDFVRSNIDGDWWIGASDQATEGAWIWAIGGNQFWSGKANGSAVGGLFSRWDGGQPDDLGGEDCAQMRSDGDWSDDACSDAEEYVCEFAVDACPADPNKSVPGECGCGTPDVDSDGDGALDCKDQCPRDPAKVFPGDCGCEDTPVAAGAACTDGLCAANGTCNGAGVCGNPASCPAPDASCQSALFLNKYYWLCRNDRTFQNARQRCQSAGMDLARVDDAREDAFITSKIVEHTFIGATDQAVEGNFTWLGSDTPFWTGGLSGQADCVVKDPPIGAGKWETRSCSSADAFACEAPGFPKPFVKCVSQINGDLVVALFGYEDPASVPVVVELGPENRLVPAPTLAGVAPPTTFPPGPHRDWVLGTSRRAECYRGSFADRLQRQR